MDTFDHRHKQFARGLRHEQTPAEMAVWEALRNRRYKGLKFRRQHVIENYVVDFFCYALDLIIELDGKVHKQQLEYDMDRQQLLEGKGYRFIRFDNRQIMNNMNFLFRTIDKFL